MMKMLLLVLGISCLTPASLFTQSIRSYGFKLGTVAADQSFSYHDLSFPISLETEKRWGIDAGMYVEFLTTAPASILGEVHYIQKGYGVTVGVTTAESPDIAGYKTIYRRIDYLSIPVFLKFRYEAGTFTPYVIGGPRVDLFLGEFEEEYDSPIDYKSADFGVSVGLGTEIAFGSAPTGLLEFRYSPDITNAYEGDFVDIRSFSFEILLGVTL